MNLVDLIKGQIGGDTLSRLGSTLGTSTEETRTAVDAAIPSVLAGLTHVASTPTAHIALTLPSTDSMSGRQPTAPPMAVTVCSARSWVAECFPA